MKIGILGAGNIGGGLGKAWAKKGHQVKFGVRNVEDPELQALLRETGATAGGAKDAAAFGEVVVLAVPYPALEAVLASVGPLDGKVVIDCTNAIGRGMTLVHGHTTSAAEETAKKIPGARVVKSFNAQGAENLENPVYGGVRATNFYCGDDAEAKRIVRQLVEDVGFEAVDAGPLRNARLLEPMTLLWLSVASSLGTRDIAFHVLKR